MQITLFDGSREAVGIHWPFLSIIITDPKPLLFQPKHAVDTKLHGLNLFNSSGKFILRILHLDPYHLRIQPLGRQRKWPCPMIKSGIALCGIAKLILRRIFIVMPKSIFILFAPFVSIAETQETLAL